jgi:hypothetical protein
MLKIHSTNGYQETNKNKNVSIKPHPKQNINTSPVEPATNASHSPPKSPSADYSTPEAVSPAPLDARDPVHGGDIVPGYTT